MARQSSYQFDDWLFCLDIPVPYLTHIDLVDAGLEVGNNIIAYPRGKLLENIMLASFDVWSRSFIMFYSSGFRQWPDQKRHNRISAIHEQQD